VRGIAALMEQLDPSVANLDAGYHYQSGSIIQQLSSGLSIGASKIDNI